MSVRVNLTAADAGIINAAYRRIRIRAAARPPSDDGQIGRTPTFGWERRGRGLAGEAATRRYLGYPVTIEALADSYGGGDLVLPNGTIIETRAVRHIKMRLARYDKDAPGRYWVKACVPAESLEALAAGRGAPVWLDGWTHPSNGDDRTHWRWREDWNCFHVDTTIMRPIPELLNHVG